MKDNRKILLVNTNYGGGAGIACRRMHEALLKNGYDSTLLVLNKVDVPNEKKIISIEEIISEKKGRWYFSLLKIANAIITKLPVGFKKEVYINGPQSLFRINELEVYKQSDIIHLHWVPKIISWKHVFADKQKKIVWTLHDMNPFTGGNHYTCDYDYSSFTNLLQKNIDEKIKAVKGCNLKIIAPSVWLANMAKASEVFKSFEVVAIPNCLDTEVFKPQNKTIEKNKLQLPAGKKVMLFVAEHPSDVRKGMQLLLKSLKQLKNTTQVCLLVIGKKIDMEASVIETKQLGVVSNQATLAQLYNAADFFVIPSLEDNLPNTMVESLACGTPVLGFRIGGLPDLIVDRETGMLAPPENTNVLAQYIDEFIAMENSTAYSSKAREMIENKCSEKVVLKQLLKIYEH